MATLIERYDLHHTRILLLMAYRQESYHYVGSLNKKSIFSPGTNNYHFTMKSAHMHKEHYVGDIETSSPNLSRMFQGQGTVWYGCQTTSNRLLDKVRLQSNPIQQNVNDVAHQRPEQHAKHAICVTYSISI